MRVVVTNAVTLNSGDAAILLGLRATLRKAFGAIDLTVLDSHASVAAQLYPDLRFEQLAMRGKRSLARRIKDRLVAAWPRFLLSFPRYSRNAKRYAEADLIVSTGGTMLVEHYDLRDRFYQLEIASSMRTPLVLYTQSLGPFAKPLNVTWLRRLLPRCDLVLLRDGRSAAHLREIEAHPKSAAIVADAAFALADPETLARARERAVPEQPKVAISVRRWKHYRSGAAAEKSDSYRQAIAALVTLLVLDRGAEVTFVSTCQGVPEYGYDDSEAAQEIVALLATDVRTRVTIDSRFRRPETLLEDLANFDLVVSTRMHMAILALCAGTPVFPIAYEFKTAEVFANLGLRDRVVDIENVRPQTLPHQVTSFIDDLPSLRPALVDAVIAQHESALSAVERLRQIVQAQT
jgi:colanic acid/amylovoran biosynthesis protein